MDATELDTKDLPELAAALSAARLPTGDLGGAGQAFWRFADAGAVLGYAGLEVRGTDALLRSVAVSAPARGRGHGRRMIDTVTRLAKARGIERLWLLTLDADGFFARMGFTRAARESAPPSITALAEFAALCPATAICMSKAI